MPFEPATLQHLEDALAEAFQFHRQLDNFILRAGLPAADLRRARELAEDRARTSQRGWRQAPKRYVAQELVNLLQANGKSGDRKLALLYTAFAVGNLRNLSTSGQAAMAAISSQYALDKKRRREACEEQLRQRQTSELEQAKRSLAAKTEFKARKREELLGNFKILTDEANAQQRGYMLESFLRDLFDLEELDPRASFKLIGEQIDGSFTWEGNYHLVEAKWQKDHVAGNDFGAFMYKIEGKSADTRGLFVAVNGYSTEALEALAGKGGTKFVCLDGAHIMRAVQPGYSLLTILRAVWRHAGETGGAYLPVSKLKS